MRNYRVLKYLRIVKSAGVRGSHLFWRSPKILGVGQRLHPSVQRLSIHYEQAIRFEVLGVKVALSWTHSPSWSASLLAHPEPARTDSGREPPFPSPSPPERNSGGEFLVCLNRPALAAFSGNPVWRPRFRLFRHEGQYSNHGSCDDQQRRIDLVLKQDQQSAYCKGASLQPCDCTFRHGKAACQQQAN